MDKKGKSAAAAAPVDPSDLPNVPKLFLCPITLEIMKEPTITSCGHMFEKEAIVGWLKGNELVNCFFTFYFSFSFPFLFSSVLFFILSSFFIFLLFFFCSFVLSFLLFFIFFFCSVLFLSPPIPIYRLPLSQRRPTPSARSATSL